MLPVYLAERAPEGEVLAALADLDRRIQARGGRLLVQTADDVPRELNRLAHDGGAWALYFNRDYTPEARERDNRVTRGMQLTGIVTMAFDDRCLVPPYRMLDTEGGMPESFEEFFPRWLEAMELPEPPLSEDGAFVPAGEMPAGGGLGDAVPAGGAADAQGADVSVALTLGTSSRSETRLAPDAAVDVGAVSPRDVARQAIAAGAEDPATAERALEALARRDFALHRDFAAPSRRADSGTMP